jgi:hypothetical protein
MTEFKRLCHHRVFSGRRDDLHGHDCTKTPVVEEDGGVWCIHHAPSTIRARNEAQQARIEAQRAQTQRDVAIRAARERVIEAAKTWAKESAVREDWDYALADAVSDLNSLEAKDEQSPRENLCTPEAREAS